jgi:sugar-specific transcriptional regulator TrmB/DNA-binding CsgD family transcriptional regulator
VAQLGQTQGTASRPLQALGIDAFEEHVYRSLLDSPGMSLRDAARRLGASPGRVRGAIAHLEALGLVTASASRPVRFSPVSPELAFEVLIRQGETGLREARAAVADLQTAYANALLEERPQQLLEVITGREAVVQHVMQLQRAAQDEILVFDRPPYAAANRQVTAEEVEHLRRGVRARVVYDRSALEVPGQLAVLRELSELGEVARLSEDLPTKMLIVDQRRAIVPLTEVEPGVHGVALIESSPLLSALVALFEAFWLTATPISVGTADKGEEGLDPDVHSLLTLLAAGLKDDAIARQLGVSRRTVQRRIRALVDILGVQSRRQIPLQAARRGLL